MWISSSKENKAKLLGIKWPNEPIKTLAVYFIYDPKLLKEKNFIERLDSIKKLINIWSSRVLSVYGKVTIIKSFFEGKNGTWKTYLQHWLEPMGGFFFLNCNYDIKDYKISSKFYCELLSWWSDFRDS